MAGNQKYCSQCGRPVTGASQFCDACGGGAYPYATPPVLSPAAVKYAGFWRRVGAFLIDAIIINVVGFVVGSVFGIGASGAAVGNPQVVGNVLGLFLNWGYYAFMESSPYQATLGKLALGIVVTDSAGGRLSFGRATGRHFGKIVSAFILLIGFMMAGWTERKQTLHDMMADCLVVCRRRS